MSTCCARGQSKLLLILPKMRCVWFGFSRSKHRQKTVLYYSRLYCTTVDRTILQYSRPYWPVQTVQYNTCIWFTLERRALCCSVVNYRFSRKTDTPPRWRWFHSRKTETQPRWRWFLSRNTATQATMAMVPLAKNRDSHDGDGSSMYYGPLSCCRAATCWRGACDVI